MMQIVYALIIGLSAGALGGMFGTGGGILIVPGLVLALGMSQHKAQGTSLACLLAPIGLLGVLSYQQKGMVDWRVAALVAIGFLGGSLAGAKLALNLDPLTMKRSFAIFLALVALWMWFSPVKTPAANEAQSEASPA